MFVADWIWAVVFVICWLILLFHMWRKRQKSEAKLRQLEVKFANERRQHALIINDLLNQLDEARSAQVDVTEDFESGRLERK